MTDGVRRQDKVVTAPRQIGICVGLLIIIEGDVDEVVFAI